MQPISHRVHFFLYGGDGKIAGFGDGSNNTHLNDENGTCCLIHCCGMIFLPFCWPCWGVHARWLLEDRLEQLSLGSVGLGIERAAPICHAAVRGP